jgi:hypothetical protein
MTVPSATISGNFSGDLTIRTGSNPGVHGRATMGLDPHCIDALAEAVLDSVSEMVLEKLIDRVIDKMAKMATIDESNVTTAPRNSRPAAADSTRIPQH